MWTMTKHHRTRVTFAFLVLLLSGGAVAGQADDWETGPLAEGGFEETLGGRLDAAFEDGRLAGLHGVVVIRQGKLRLERYYAGADERWGQTLGVVEHHAETRHDLRSVSVPTTAIESFLMKTSPSVTIELPDDVRFFRYPELSVQLRDALDDGPSVLVDALAVKSLDIVAMQIFVSAQKTARQKGKHLKILLASGGDADDDSPSVRQMVRMTPVGAGYQVVEAADGAEALSKATAQRYDAVLTDLNMPVMHGIEFIKKFRAHPSARGVPVVVLTTESDDAVKRQAREAGTTGWLVKPFRQEQLLAAIKKVAGA